MKCWVLSQFWLWDSHPGSPIPKQRWYQYTKGSDPEVWKNHFHHYIPPPFEERRLKWGDSIYHSAAACTQSCSIKHACIYTTGDTIVCDEICIHTNCSIDPFSIASSPIEVQCAESVPTFKIQTRDLRFQREDDTDTETGLTQKCGRITYALHWNFT